MSQQCNTCEQDLPIESFYVRNKATGARQYKCKSCSKSYNKRYYDDGYRDKQIPKSIAKNKERAVWYQEWKAKQKCQVCGEDAIECLDLHHMDPNKKDFVISENISRYGMKTLQEEIAKCLVVCSNCHRKIHSGRIKA